VARAETIYEGNLILDESFETADRSVRGWCDRAASLRGRDPRSRGTSTGEDTDRLNRLGRRAYRI
jgi:hypothetical protein